MIDEDAPSGMATPEFTRAVTHAIAIGQFFVLADRRYRLKKENETQWHILDGRRKVGYYLVDEWMYDENGKRIEGQARFYDNI